MDKNELKDLLARVRSLRPPSNSTAKHPGVDLLRSRLAEAADDEEVATLLHCLAAEYSWLGVKSEQERTLRDLIDRFGSEPGPWISLATFLTYDREDLEEADRVADIAIARARETSTFIRHAYNTKARISVKRRDYAGLEAALMAMLSLPDSVGRPDSPCEMDFLDGLTASLVNGDLLERYRRLASKRGH
jgi:hypothetical protein